MIHFSEFVHPVLDHGSVQLVRASPESNWIGAVADSARVSHLTARKRSSDERLVRSLIQRRHVSTLSHVTMTWKVVLPIFVARQWMRHWSWQYNEASARYSEMPDRFYVPEEENIGLQSATEHQGRAEADPGIARTAREVIKESYEFAMLQYRSLLSDGISREVARIVLPVGLYTEFFATCSLRDWIFFLTQRMDSHAQWEIRQYANVMHDVVAEFIDATFMQLLDETMLVGVKK